MHVSYNGVPLEIVTIDRVERRSILTPDETEVLYVEWAISLSCVYHPEQGVYAGTSVTFPNPADKNPVYPNPTPLGIVPNPAPIEFPGVEYPILTDRELLLRLSVPRQPLLIWAYDLTGNPVVWLRSPRLAPGGNSYMPRDALSGPIVQANVVTAHLGNAVTFGVQMEIKTWVPPCPDGSDRLILAHRWQMAHTQDENYYLTRQTTGEIYFHGGVKDLFGVRVDAVTNQLLHPIPLGFRRFLGPVTLSPDGLVIRYSFADVDQKVVFDPGLSGATTMAISENVVYRTPFQGQEFLAAFLKGALGGAFGAGGGAGGAALGAVGGMAVGGIPGAIIGGIGGRLLGGI